MPTISAYTAATAVTDDDVFVGNDGATTKKFPATVIKTYMQSGGSATYVVAANNATATIKARADYVCDGTADQTEINTALALGSVQLTDGVYNISAPVTMARAGTRLMGTGMYRDLASGFGGIAYGAGSSLKAVSGFSGTSILRVASGNATYNTSGQTVRDLSINGNSIGSGLIGLHWTAYQGQCDNVEVSGCTGDGIYSEPLAGWDNYDTRFTNIHSSYNTAAGFSYTSADGHLSSSIFHNNGINGIYAAGSSWQITQVHCYANTKEGIVLIGGNTSRTKITNCKVEHSGWHGINHVGSSSGSEGVQIVGCGFSANGEATHNTYGHIALGGPNSFYKGIISGCYFGTSDGATNLPAYALIVADQTRYLACTGNTFGGDNGGSVSAFYGPNATMLSTSRFTGNVGLSDRGTG